MHGFLNLIPRLRWQDALDVVIVAYVIYRIAMLIRGTRTMLRCDQWLPRRSRIDIEIADAIKPGGSDFASVLRLRDAAREAMLARCGEPDLGELIKPPARA